MADRVGAGRAPRFVATFLYINQWHASASSTNRKHQAWNGAFPRGAIQPGSRTIIEPIVLHEELKLQVNCCPNAGDLAS